MSKARAKGDLIIFKLCAACNKNYEFLLDFFDFQEDDLCIYCANGDEVPFKHLEYITLEDLDGEVVPRRLQECFAKIDEPTIEQIMIDEHNSSKKKKRKKTPETK